MSCFLSSDEEGVRRKKTASLEQFIRGEMTIELKKKKTLVSSIRLLGGYTIFLHNFDIKINIK